MFRISAKRRNVYNSYRFKPIQNPRINNQIRVPEVRVVGKDGDNLGVMETAKALMQAQSDGLDLIEVAAKAKPPVVRIMDYGKYQYQKEKEARDSAKKQKSTEVKGIRIGFNASRHDMELKAKKVEEFLAEGDKVKVDFILKGRAKYLDRNFIRERFNTFLSFIATPYKTEGEPKRAPRGLSLIVEPDKKA
ncbi:MAG: translation initiation factor IF-3 [Candidatus Ryanbacteria bacterium CG10_big_fil_rev_8_21_14_0_10_43_42]|uniref:Translation initiation factor IF-3 n=1 Tax=Candidatus Ryanbacteria bacterium CG10_big_fil_rev_8_21_14_0_10_43_42 TaxID=1974864 RepID=A0A2M8KXW0_9BACT|nr:MAG: translation initiation factor IF-3 [Candidatus Ryanbacteria bacterium CG10_big_fil_rev_8_21_14_0_10_43_42]